MRRKVLVFALLLPMTALGIIPVFLCPDLCFSADQGDGIVQQAGCAYLNALGAVEGAAAALLDLPLVSSFWLVIFVFLMDEPVLSLFRPPRLHP